MIKTTIEKLIQVEQSERGAHVKIKNENLRENINQFLIDKVVAGGLEMEVADLLEKFNVITEDEKMTLLEMMDQLD
ncbi:hypothetical protein P4I85_29285 [Bacillus cereus]|uniref:hypothetical protein n=1 Tax=Bacillus thuringiensis TaxID=1428 RepID=UPI000A39A1B6|nr:hypothetical protein [Bacillus thuringiensis]MDA2153067.1 hypothetical protein [Bacillus cereus]MDA2561851.1 hypothetical protein [Bacillus cereus]MDA2615983.1 hypothetical protein [Bacillus cereus]MEB9163939.1 hypothetical protein [Bacillus cereus]MEB9512798.1 hypothetical protein [Bacillus cereus]